MDLYLVKSRAELEEIIKQQENQITTLKQRLNETEQHYCEKGFFIENLLTELENLKEKIKIIEQVIRS